MVTLPTKNELFEATLADLNAEYGITIPLFGKNFLRAMAAVHAGTHWLIYKSIANTQKNIFIDTADPESQGGTLERFGRIKLGRNPNPATSSIYTVQFTATAGTIPASTTFKSDDGSLNPGELYVIDQASILIAPFIYTVISTNRGLETKLEIGDTITVTSPVPGLTSPVGIIVGETTAPIAAETVEDYRRKGLDSYRLEPQGGSGSDYRIWASEVPGVLQSYNFAASGAPNEVNLFIEATIGDSTDGKGTPTATIISDVTAAIENATALRPQRKPLTVDVNYLPISPLDVVITVSGAAWQTPAIETNINLLLADKIEVIRPFVSSIDVLSEKNDTFGVNDIIAVIASNYPGQVFNAPVLSIDGSPVTSSFTFNDGDIPFFVSFVFN